MKKKLVQIISAIVLSISFVSVGASAQVVPPAGCGNFVIYNTGPNSSNVAVCVDNVTLTAVCDNNIYVLDTNSQSAVSGEAIAQGNTGGGNAVSGDATNANNQVVQIGASCGTAATPVSPSPSPSPSPSTSPAPVKPVALPNTASTDASAIIVASLAAAAGVVVLSRLAVAAYNRFGNK